MQKLLKSYRISMIIISVFAIAVSQLIALPIMALASPAITEYPIPNSSDAIRPTNIANGPDGAIWYTTLSSNRIGRFALDGSFSFYNVAPAGENYSPHDITAGPDGAMWFTNDNTKKIGRITTSGEVTYFSFPSSSSRALDITSGPDGALWFTEGGFSKIGRITTSGDITEYPIPTPGGSINITSGPDGALWFTEYSQGSIGRITTSGDVTEYPISSDLPYPYGLTSGPDGALWFAESNGNNIGRITTDGSISEYPIPTLGSGATYITAGPDGALWFTEGAANKIGRITTDGSISEYPIPTPQSNPIDILTGPDGALWFTETWGGNNGTIGRISVDDNVGISPAITSADSAITSMRTPFNFHVTTTGSPASAITVDGALPAGVTFSDNGDGTAEFSGITAAGTSGAYPVTIAATNGIGASAIQSFVLTVTDATSTPIITSSSSDTETFGVPFSFNVNTTGYPVPKLTKTGALPSGLTFVNNGDGTATISGTAAASAEGVYNLTIKAKSTAGTITQAFALTITKAPVVKTISNKTSTVGAAFSMNVTASGYTTPTLTASGLPNGLDLTDNGDGTASIAGTPATGSGGSYAITVTASNELGSSDRTFTLKVKEVPVIASAASASASVGSPFSFQVAATGFPTPNISKTGTLPKGVTFKASTGTFSGTPKAGTVGTYPVTITAKNSAGTVTQSFVLVVQ